MVPTPRRMSLTAARRVALGAQGFADPLPRGRVDRRHLRRVMDRLGLIQLDSVPVVIRTQYLPAFSRLGAYEPELMDRIAYDHGEWFETWAHVASLVPVESEPLLRWEKHEALEKGNRHLREVLHDHDDYVEAVYQQVAERGPLAAAELDDPRPRSGEWWNGRSIGTVTLDWLFFTGRVGIRRYGNFEKRFDIIERIVPSEILSRPTPPVPDAHRELVALAAGSLGVGTASDLADYWRIPIRSVRPRIDELVEDGRLTEVAVQGWDEPAYLDPAARRPRSFKRAALLSPFDPVVWHRGRAERLFGFDYRIEIYVPAPQRRYGYYVLPFLLDNDLVGRVDLKTDRSAGVLRVRGAFAEEDVGLGEVAGPMATELEDLARLVGVDEVGVDEDARGDLIPDLRHHL